MRRFYLQPLGGAAGTMTPLDRLYARLATLGRIAVAVSGGVDSLTLATAAHRALGAAVTMHHAISPAVPIEATERTQALAASEGWQLDIFDAQELAAPINPVNGCFFCDTNLYSFVATRTTAQIVSGTNLDDLGEYRPGLDTARDDRVRHPYVEADIDKADVRRLAATLGLGALAELPAAPCLSSRSETGMHIEAELLSMVHQAERMVAERLLPRTVRCRVRAPNGVRCIVIELDEQTMAKLDAAHAEQLQVQLNALASPFGVPTVAFSAYR